MYLVHIYVELPFGRFKFISEPMSYGSACMVAGMLRSLPSLTVTLEAQ